MSADGSNGYEEIASIYIAGRGTRARVGDSVGAAIVRAWAQAFPPGATVLDLGSGAGEPSTRSEEHTSELQSREKLVCRRLLDNKNGVGRPADGRVGRAQRGQAGPGRPDE